MGLSVRFRGLSALSAATGRYKWIGILRQSDLP
ncbi:hypothetical protein CGCVW01_v013204 [Colletotrichum viniferum]|nr:hypothetical protein CGCVW01_v013204 [Colletotrichum viniferum]